MAKIGAAKSVAVSFLGKLKTTAQMIAIPMLLYHDPLGAFDPQQWGTWLIYCSPRCSRCGRWSITCKMAMPDGDNNIG